MNTLIRVYAKLASHLVLTYKELVHFEKIRDRKVRELVRLCWEVKLLFVTKRWWYG